MKSIIVNLCLALVYSLNAEPSSVLGRMGTMDVTTSEIREILAGMDGDQQATLARDPVALGQYVRTLLVQRMVLSQALERKWDQQPAVVARLERARESVISESYLQNESTPEPGYPNEAELARAYESGKSTLKVPRSFSLAQVFIATDKAKLAVVVKQLQAKDADFSAIARKFSEETASAAKGGEIGWLTEDQIEPGIREKLPAIVLGAISEPIRLKDGWHILKVLDIREAYTPTLEQIRGKLTDRLRSERSQLKRQEFLSKLILENPVAIDEIELNRVIPSSVKAEK